MKQWNYKIVIRFLLEKRDTKDQIAVARIVVLTIFAVVIYSLL